MSWDADRSTPKTADEAREALAYRIADHVAPDSALHAGAYGEAT